MAVSLRPRHPADIREERAERLKQRPSILARRGPSPLLTVLPAILTAVAVYAGLVYFDRIARRLAGEWAAEAAPSEERDLRDIDGVAPTPTFLETPPPPSPESVVEAQSRARASAGNFTPPAPPVLLPELEPEPVAPGRDSIVLEGVPAGLRFEALQAPTLPPPGGDDAR